MTVSLYVYVVFCVRCDIDCNKPFITFVAPKQGGSHEDMEDGGMVRDRPGALEATTVTDLIDLGEKSKVSIPTVEIAPLNELT